MAKREGKKGGREFQGLIRDIKTRRKIQKISCFLRTFSHFSKIKFGNWKILEKITPLKYTLLE